MKILWLSHLVPYPPKAGVLLRAHYLLKELARYHEVHLIAFNQRMLIEPYFTNYEEGTKIAFDTLRQFCPRVEFLDCPMDKSKTAKYVCAAKSLFSKNPYTINWLKDKRYQEIVDQWHQVENYDLIHCDTISLAPYVEKIKDTKTSLDHHNVESHMLFRRAELEGNTLKSLYFKFEGEKLKKIEQHYCPRFDTNITCSELDSQRFNMFIADCEFVEIPNGVDIEFFKPGNSEVKRASFIFIGTLDWYPNTRAVRFIANEIWPALKKKIPDAELNIIGSGAPKDLINFAKDKPSFNVLGFVDDLAPYLERATAYLCPIDDGGGTKLKLLDAFASGKAVIANEIACEGLKVKDGDNVLFAETTEEYVDKIERVVNNPALRIKLESNSHKHVVENFSFRSIGEKLSNHFISITSKE